MTKDTQKNEYHDYPINYTGGNDLFTLFIVMWRRKFMIILILILGFITTYFLVSQATPRYVAEAHILVQIDSNNFSIENILKSNKTNIFDLESVLTELEILKSRRLASQVVKKLNLIQDKRFKISDSDKTSFNNHSTSTFRDTSVSGTDLKTLPPEAIDPQVSAAVTKFLESLKAVSVPGSLAVKIVYTSPNPQQASIIVNTLIDEYIALKLEEKFEARKRVTDWLDNRLITLRKNLLDLETRIQEHKVKYKLFPEKQDVITTRQVTNLNDRYLEVKEEYDHLKSQINRLSDSESIDVISAMNLPNANTAIIRKLQSDKIEINKKSVQLSNRYGPKHPSMVKVNTELEDINFTINAEVKKVKNVLNSELKNLKTRLKDIEKDIQNEQFDEEKVQDSAALAELNDLEREAAASRLVLKTFLETYKKSVGKNDLEESEVKIISHASIPTEPTYPNKPLILALGFIISLMMGIVFAIIFEKIAIIRRMQPE